jgi:hypothetical protein
MAVRDVGVDLRRIDLGFYDLVQNGALLDVGRDEIAVVERLTVRPDRERDAAEIRA